MKKKQILCILALFCLGLITSQNKLNVSKKLYPIIENGLWGYIDSSGKQIIKPKFKSVSLFEENLAAVRLNGNYGYIDVTGAFKIQPKFDMAHKFQNGIALVYIDGKPFLINKKGHKLFDHNYSEIINSSEENIYFVRNKKGKIGLITKSGKKIISPKFTRIGSFSNEHLIVHKNKKTGVIDTNGKWIIPLGKYDKIYPFKSGLALVTIPDVKENEEDQAFIDVNDKIQFKIPYDNWRLEYGYEFFNDDVASIKITPSQANNLVISNSDNLPDYAGVINTKGEILFSSKDFKEITPFSNDVAFVENFKNKYFLINSKGEIISPEFTGLVHDTYDVKPEKLFENGIDFVETKDGWGVINTKGEFIKKPREFDFDYSHVSRSGRFLILHQDISIENDSYSYQYGFWDSQNDIVIEPQFFRLEFLHNNDLVYVLNNKEEVGYIDYKGNYIWKHKENKEIKKLNIDYMNRGYFYASSPYKKELAGYGGWGGSNNIFQKNNDVTKLENEKFEVYVDSEIKDIYKKEYKGIKLFVRNNSKDTIFFDAQDSRLDLKIQAKDKKGKWRDIEYSPNSWCGNSYHSLFLPFNHFWEFTIPVYEGEFQTELRAKLSYKKTLEGKEKSIYSNTFKGSINPAQFWRKQTYYSKGLMDPYND